MIVLQAKDFVELVPELEGVYYDLSEDGQAVADKVLEFCAAEVQVEQMYPCQDKK